MHIVTMPRRSWAKATVPEVKRRPAGPALAGGLTERGYAGRFVTQPSGVESYWAECGAERAAEIR